jgi:3-phenylpropionate/trans-cinnamate dioxygenase ferredoxin reductase subunit
MRRTLMSARSGSVKPRVVVVGAGAAGDAVAGELRKSGFDGSVVLTGADRHRAYYRPYLSKEFLRDEVAGERTFLRGQDAYADLDIEWLGGQSVVEVDRHDSTAVLDNGRSLRFDSLVLATGGTPRWLADVPRAANAFTLRTLDDSSALRQALAESRRLLVIGAGFIGAEVAASMRTTRKDVLVIERGLTPLSRALGEEMGEVYAGIHRQHGVDLRTGTAVTRWLTRGDRVEAVELDDGSREEVDTVLIAVGVEPELSLARALGLELRAGGVATDEWLQAAPGVYCAGDIAAQFHPVFGRHVRVEHWDVARKQGQTIGRVIAGHRDRHEVLPWFWSDQYDVKLQYLGNTAGFDQTVWRGKRDGLRFSVFYLKEGVVEGVLAVNDGKTIRSSRELISRRRAIDPALLGAEETDLAALSQT